MERLADQIPNIQVDIPTLESALTPNIQGRNRVRWQRHPRTVRGQGQPLSLPRPVTRVKLEQASKVTLWTPPRRTKS
jgi:hypothetical protein